MAVAASTVVCASNYTGTVVNADNNTLVELANVSFFATDSVFVGGGWTDDKGIFNISVTAPANRIVISCVGYKPLDVSTPAPFAGGELGIIEISPDSMLDEVTVIGEGRITKMNRTSYLITDELRKNAMTPWTVMERLNGFHVDPVTLSVDVGTTKNVPILVDGQLRDIQHLLTINPKRIKSISIIEHPQGRHSGQEKIIDIQLFTDYIGWSVSNRDFIYNSLTNSNNTQTAVMSGTWTFNKWSLSGGLSYQHSYAVSRSHSDVDYAGVLTQRTDGNRYRRQCLKQPTANIGLDYRFSQDRMLILQAKFSDSDLWGKSHETTVYNSLSDNGELVSDMDTHSENRPRRVSATASYSDKFGKKWELAADVTYVHEKNKQSSVNNYGEDYAQKFLVSTTSDNVMSNVTTTYHPLDNLDISLTDRFGYDRMISEDVQTWLNPYSMKRFTNSMSLDLSWFVAGRWLFMATGYAEYIHSNSMDYTESKFIGSPQCSVKWFTDAGQKSSITATYMYVPTYPGLNELSTNTVPVGLLLYKVGNPDMESGSQHVASLRFSYKYRLYAQLSYSYNDNVPRFMMYNPGAAYYILQPVPTTDSNVSVSIAGNVNFSKFALRGSFDYKHYWMTAPSYKTGGDSYFLNVNGTCSLDKSCSADIEYTFRHYDKPGLHQTAENYADDLRLGLRARLAGDRVQAYVSCSLPLHILPRWTRTYDDFTFYRSCTYYDRFYDNTYVNMVVTISLGNGKSLAQGDKSRFRQTRSIE